MSHTSKYRLGEQILHDSRENLAADIVAQILDQPLVRLLSSHGLGLLVLVADDQVVGHRLPVSLVSMRLCRTSIIDLARSTDASDLMLAGIENWLVMDEHGVNDLSHGSRLVSLLVANLGKELRRLDLV